jgi:hypothetical protein
MNGDRMPKSDDLAPIAVAEAVSRRMVEEAGADAVVIIWTSQSRRSTRVYRHQYGNLVLCRALVEKVALDQASEVDGDDD